MQVQMADRSASIQIRLTPVKLVILAIVGLLLIWILISWAKTFVPPTVDTKWSKPIPMENVNFLCHWNGYAVAIGRGGVFRVLNEAGQWEEKTVPGFEAEKNESCAPIIVDPHGPQAVFFDITFSNKVQAIHSFICLTMSPQKKPLVGERIPLQKDVQHLFGEVSSSSGFKREIRFFCHEGFAETSEFYIPYSASTEDITERITSTGTRQQTSQAGPSQCGLFWSPDRGQSWQVMRLAQFNTAGQSAVRRAGNTFCYLAADSAHSLWVSTRTSASSNWSQPKLLCDTLKTGDQFLTGGDKGTLHLCWMDMRLKKGLGFFIYGDWDIGRKNNQVFYRNYRDNDGQWSKEKRLSGNLSYCERPSMSVEGRRIVVVWHNLGERTPKTVTRKASPYARAAIYYATSKDDGRTWSRPVKIKGSENSAGMYPCPKVILHQRVIHVFYNGVYQHRDFPDG